MKCPKCQSELDEQTIEDRLRTACPSCSYMHYERRQSTNGPQMLLDEIADDVANNGYCETLTAGIRNFCFRTSQELADWCKLHNFSFSLYIGPDASGKDAEYVRVSRYLPPYSAGKEYKKSQ